MRKLIDWGIFLIILGLIFTYREDIMKYSLNLLGQTKKEAKLTYSNEYSRKKDYKYVQITNDFTAHKKSDFLNIYYTIVDSGIDEFTFYCDYDSCNKDISIFAEDQKVLSNINSFVHPYNSFTSIKTEYDTLNRIKIKIEKAYNNNEITKINEKIEEIKNKYIKNTTDKKEIIKIVHDYIINHSKYDTARSDNNIKTYSSTIAYGPLLQGYGLCGGYTDALALFLDLYDIPNFKIISENHIWNAIYLNNTWYHLDLTWDDPVSKDGRDLLDYTFFLIKTNELEKIETTQHRYDKNVFIEIE